jgi:hypothetical protein
MIPTAEIQVRQVAPHCSAGPSTRHSNRIGADLPSRADAGSLSDVDIVSEANAIATARKRVTPVPLSLLVSDFWVRELS